jgi:2-polyprenyl-3-methyl-5-hydroxy-6-metoxy-1,4-benzoquinol methylase
MAGLSGAFSLKRHAAFLSIDRKHMDDTGYQIKPAPYFKYGRREMLPFMPAHATNVLEIGCGEGEFAATLKAERQVQVTGIEPFEAAARIADARIDRVLHVDVNAGIVELKGELFDCIVCNDVLEHLVDPWDTLKRLRPLLADHGVLIASLPNMRYMPVLKDLVLKGEWRYQDQGVMDRTHLRFFTQKSMQTLFEESGYRMTHIQGINAMALPWKFSLLNRLTLGAFSDAQYQQYACVAQSA